ncbi:sulfurtransferase TusA [Simiduia curdlanivorans]|uniref:Sulfurtransferase TusA n=1 Tax=Simiduia curdlanivorans TaxID=1492769 RepID=A0ABV8V2K3_9GAMM|nr:sulfurtransferase TusA [Simiduia curdlanivorans]MDN3640165.1 sulfurtransferase TusA [Simiduia curdlanivorans]
MSELDWAELQAQAKHTLDASGLFCPEPVMLLHNVVRDAAPGDKILVLATDPSTVRDIPKFCQFLSHLLIASGEHDGKYCYLLAKAS